VIDNPLPRFHNLVAILGACPEVNASLASQLDKMAVKPSAFLGGVYSVGPDVQRFLTEHGVAYNFLLTKVTTWSGSLNGLALAHPASNWLAKLNEFAQTAAEISEVLESKSVTNIGPLRDAAGFFDLLRVLSEEIRIDQQLNQDDKSKLLDVLTDLSRVVHVYFVFGSQSAAAEAWRIVDSFEKTSSSNEKQQDWFKRIAREVLSVALTFSLSIGANVTTAKLGWADSGPGRLAPCFNQQIMGVLEAPTVGDSATKGIGPGAPVDGSEQESTNTTDGEAPGGAASD
jgi:hypothetical protein